jgi:hypothetical protein
MRTTISINDSLLEQARKVSQQRDCSLGEVIEDALRTSLVARPKSKRDSNEKPLKTFRGSGLLPGVDLSSSAAVLDAMEGR